jgi:transposase InsO family protein
VVGLTNVCFEKDRPCVVCQVGKQVEEYLEEEGIKHDFSAPYTPQQNGIVERKNMMLIDKARTMLGE